MYTIFSKAFSTNDAFLGLRRKYAFTLAEVLITLGIIGIVAAMTMPALIQKISNRVVETRLKKFYSAINQAVKMAEVDYGDKKIWFADVAGSRLDEEGNPIEGSSESEKWFNKYLAPYIKIVKKETLSGDGNLKGTFIAYFADGSALAPKNHSSGDWYFFPGNAKKCMEKFQDIEQGLGICVFLFQFNPSNKGADFKFLYNKGFEPYKFAWDGTEESLYDSSRYYYTGCSASKRGYCTALIQYNNWKIPDDYPYKVSY